MLQQKLASLPYTDYVLKVDSFFLASGQNISDVSIAYRVHGRVGDPLVFVLGGISAHRGLNDESNGKKPWWKDLVGPGKSIDTERYCVVGFDYLGGDGGTTGANDYEGLAALDIDTTDQGRAIFEIQKTLGYQSIHAIVGASYGAMVGLSFSQQFPQLIKKVVAISGAHRSHPMAMAWRYLQREMLSLADKAADEGRKELNSKLVALSRALAMTTYRSPEEFSQRFHGMEEVAGYLDYCGRSFASNRDYKSYFCLSQSIDRHQIAVERNAVELHIIGFAEDRLVPKNILQELALKSGGQLHSFHSLYGHDAFLKEFRIFNRLLPKLLEGNIR